MRHTVRRPPHSFTISLRQPIRYDHCFGFQQTFDTVWHVTLLQKLAQLNIPDCVYNWWTCLVDMLTVPDLVGSPRRFCLSLQVLSGVHLHCIGLASFIVNAADLTPANAGNLLAISTLMTRTILCRRLMLTVVH